MHRTTQMGGYQGQYGDFALGVSDSGGSVGYADNVIHDSPPLTGRPGSTTCDFNDLTNDGIPGYTAANESIRTSYRGDDENA